MIILVALLKVELCLFPNSFEAGQLIWSWILSYHDEKGPSKTEVSDIRIIDVASVTPYAKLIPIKKILGLDSTENSLKYTMLAK